MPLCYFIVYRYYTLWAKKYFYLKGLKLQSLTYTCVKIVNPQYFFTMYKLIVEFKILYPQKYLIRFLRLLKIPLEN
ncbi:hypothetical protein bsdE14_15900 [Clostridium omnivorum]|uniref:Uncharacterized protein n=1 Tax=Clostridium omnivorum TaxID=1604902 RepID=A0ABQ5N4Q0_9CLOT|nr:hypothetical protein bsdE14_15900 [Clostridium sp. E14]